MKFVIRDDDTCGFTSPDEILSCYQSMWPQIPVSLSVTPFRVPGNDRNAPEHLKGNMDVLPLDKNDEIVNFLKQEIKNANVDITLHGYNHWRCQGLPEFIGGENLRYKAEHGKSYIDELLGVNIKTFVPPNNGIKTAGLNAITAAGMNLGGTTNLWSSAERKVTLKSLSYCPSVWMHHYLFGKKYPYIIDLGDHQEVYCHTIGPRSNFDQALEELFYCHKHNGVYILATHYHAFERTNEKGLTVRKMVDGLVEQAHKMSNVEFVGFNSIWH